MIKKLFIIACSIVVILLLAILITGPVPTPAEKDCLTIKGTVTDIYEGGVKDAVFKLKEHKTLFYVNRGFENGLDLTQLKEELTGKEVVIKYPDYFAILDMDESIRHISKIVHEGKTIYSEIDL